MHQILLVTGRKELPVDIYSPVFAFPSRLQPPERALRQLKIGQDTLKYATQGDIVKE